MPKDSFVEDSFVEDSFVEDSFVEDKKRYEPIPTFRNKRKEEATFESVLRQPSALLAQGISQIPKNPLAGLANIGQSALSTVALPFSIGDVALRKVPVIGEPTANAIAFPFQKIAEGVVEGQNLISKTGVPQFLDKSIDTYTMMRGGTPMTPQQKGETAEAMTGVNQGLAQLLLPAKLGKKAPSPFLRSKEVTVKTSEPIPPFKGTSDAIEFGKKATPEQVEQLKIQREEYLSDFQKLYEAGDKNAAIKKATESQFFREAAEASVTPVQKIIGIIKDAKPLRKEQEKIYSQERGKRAKMLAQAFEGTQGEQSYYSALSTQKGQLPKVEFESVRPKVGQADIDYFFNEVKNSDKLREYDKLSTQTALYKLFSKEGGQLPTQGELILLEKVFGKEFAQAILDKRSNWRKVKDEVMDAANLPRTLMSAFDMSMPLRQGIVQTISHPILGAKSFKEMHKAFFSEKAYRAVKEDLNTRPNKQLYEDFKLEILDPDAVSEPLSKREDGFVSRIAHKIPIIGRGIRSSERAAYTYTNKLRADVFDMYADELRKSEITPAKDPKTYQALAEWVNTSTGRGKYGSLERFAPTASALLFSPRLLKSRLDVLRPDKYIKMPKEVRVMAMKDMLKFAGSITGMLSLAKLGGASVETDPRSTDFAKIKMGNTRFEITGGFQPILRFLAQVSTAQRKNYRGEIVEMDNSTPFAGNRLQNIYRFGEGKLNPQFSLIADYLRGENFVGNELNFSDEVVGRITPLYLQDAYDAMKEKGVEFGVASAVPAFYGVGTTTYKPRPFIRPPKISANF